MPSEHVLACNAGSSSLKLSLFAGWAGQQWNLLHTITLPAGSKSFAQMLGDWLAQVPPPDQALHRIVHAGLVPEQARLLDAEAIAGIHHWLPLAPRHNALTLELIDALQQQRPQLPQFAIYDSGLYANLPEYSARYALPADLSARWPLRRYGFHGLAHRNQWRQVNQLTGKRAEKLISIHLGSGASITAWQGDQVMDTSMGFSPLEGLIMARRSGSIDPGILTHLLLREGLSAAQLDQLLHEHSGLSALAGNDGDMRQIMLAAADQGWQSAAGEAVTQYCYQIRKTIGSYMSALGGVNAITLGGGVAEHQPLIRAQIFEGMAGLGIRVDESANKNLSAAGVFHHSDSRCALYLTPVNEMEEMLRQYEAHVLNRT